MGCKFQYEYHPLKHVPVLFVREELQISTTKEKDNPSEVFLREVLVTPVSKKKDLKWTHDNYYFQGLLGPVIRSRENQGGVGSMDQSLPCFYTCRVFY